MENNKKKKKCVSIELCRAGLIRDHLSFGIDQTHLECKQLHTTLYTNDLVEEEVKIV